MNILHIGLASHYTEGMNYQDEIIPEYNCKDGHSVTYISDAYKYKDGKLVYVGEEDKSLNNGIRLIRVTFEPSLSKLLSDKYMKSCKIAKYLEEIQPDSILFHGVGGASLLDVIEYVKNHPKTLLYADCHASFINSSRNILSWFFNKTINGFFIKRAMPHIKKFLYVSEESKEYLQKMYKIPEARLEWFPLGGRVYEYEEKQKARAHVIDQLGLSKDTLIYCHSGKITKAKKTIELIKAFSSVESSQSTLIIIGSIEDELQNELMDLISQDKRIHYLGWKSGKELNDYFLAADIYCQPGTVSASLQNAMCCGCAIISFPWPAYTMFNTDCIYWARTDEELIEQFSNTSSNREGVETRKRASLAFAKKYLDYQIISRRIYQ